MYIYYVRKGLFCTCFADANGFYEAWPMQNQAPPKSKDFKGRGF